MHECWVDSQGILAQMCPFLFFLLDFTHILHLFMFADHLENTNSKILNVKPVLLPYNVSFSFQILYLFYFDSISKIDVKVKKLPGPVWLNICRFTVNDLDCDLVVETKQHNKLVLSGT